MSPVYGRLVDDQFDTKMALEAAGKNGVYGVKAEANPDVVVKTPAVEKKPEPVNTSIGPDYNLTELKEALEASPALLDELIVAELARPTGPRKGALVHFVSLIDENSPHLDAIEEALVALSQE